MIADTERYLYTFFNSLMKRSFIKFHSPLQKYSNIYHRTYLCRYRVHCTKLFEILLAL